jgi:hypothetical protein
LIECWQLLDGLLGPVNGEPRRHLMLPSRQYFPATTASGQSAHLGFGLFGANTAFEFRQFIDFDRQGWS